MSPAYVMQERPGANLNLGEDTDEHKCGAMEKSVHVWIVMTHERMTGVQALGRPAPMSLGRPEPTES